MLRLGQVLIVEDESSIRNSLKRFLEDGGFATQTASSAAEAKTCLLQNPVKVCIADVGLPDYEVVDWIPEMARLYPNLEWVLYTGVIDYILPDQLVEAGIKSTHLFYKPTLSLSQLKKLIFSLCRE